MGIATLGVLACEVVERPEQASPSAMERPSESAPDLRPEISEPAALPLIILPEPAETEEIAERPTTDTRFFESAQPIILEEAIPVIVQGRVESVDDVLVWNFGPFNPGDNITIELLDAIEGYALVALFDGDYDILQLGVLRSPGGLPDQARVARSVFAPTDALYLAVCPRTESAPVVVRLQVVRARQEAAPVAKTPRIVLNFDGAEDVTLGTGEGIRIEPFLAEHVSHRFQGATDSIRSLVVDAVSRDFEAFGILVFDRPAGDDVDPDALVVHLGRVALDGFGAAGSQAAVNTDAFTALDRLTPSIEELAQAIANVASHESGHLLGLNHTLDAADIMNPTANLADLLLDQTFRHAPLDPKVFPIGAQDGAKWIAARVGATSDSDPSRE